MTDRDTARSPARHIHCLIITLSDRAFSGAYADRSGPRARELLASFFDSRGIESTIEQCVLPDDAALLRREILAGREQGVDVLITTGGTGVGPRHCSGNRRTALRQADPRHHGTYPRQVRGKQPAGPVEPCDCRRSWNNADIYTLPGSVRAVEEYLPEILVTLEHLADTLHHVDTHQ